ncbi:MAG: TIGR00303 family protein [Methanomicrobiales archaeon]|nr:TIGR00303 family protein [Methanomicrobiales archaeon]
MPFITPVPDFTGKCPLFGIVLGNTMLSTVPGISGAGPTPEKTVLTPILDSELIAYGRITSRKSRPNTPTGCPTPAVITRAMMDLCGEVPVFINAGLVHRPLVPCYDVYGEPGGDPRLGDAVGAPESLWKKGEVIGKHLSRCSDTLILGECVPGGTTTALCVLRGLGYPARVSSSFVANPLALKEEVCHAVIEKLPPACAIDPMAVIRYGGDPMMPVAAGIASAYRGHLLLAGGTQMLAVVALLKAAGMPLPDVVTTVYVRDDSSANFTEIAQQIGCRAYYIDPGFGELGHVGLARYCIGEVKEGIGAGGAMLYAYINGHSDAEIRQKILQIAGSYA